MALLEDSLAGQIRGLRVGMSVSRTKRIAIDDNKPRVDIQVALKRLRNQINNAVSRIRSGFEGTNFRVESTVGITDDRSALLCTVAVTCLAGDALVTPDDEETDI